MMAHARAWTPSKGVVSTREGCFAGVVSFLSFSVLSLTSFKSSLGKPPDGSIPWNDSVTADGDGNGFRDGVDLVCASCVVGRVCVASVSHAVIVT